MVISMVAIALLFGLLRFLLVHSQPGRTRWLFLSGQHFYTRIGTQPDDTYNRQIQEIDIPEEGGKVHLKSFGFVRVFRTVSTDGDAEEEKTEDKEIGESEEKKVQYWATNDLEMTEKKREELARRGLGGGDLPLQAQAILWSRALSMPKCRGATQPHSDVDSGLPAVGTAPSGDGDQLLRVEDRDHSGGDPGVFGRSNPRSALRKSKFTLFIPCILLLVERTATSDTELTLSLWTWRYCSQVSI